MEKDCSSSRFSDVISQRKIYSRPCDVLSASEKALNSSLLASLNSRSLGCAERLLITMFVSLPRQRRRGMSSKQLSPRFSLFAVHFVITCNGYVARNELQIHKSSCEIPCNSAKPKMLQTNLGAELFIFIIIELSKSSNSLLVS